MKSERWYLWHCMKNINLVVASYKYILTFFLFCLMWPALVSAACRIVSWNPNPEPDISHYILSYGTTSRVYTDSMTVYGTSEVVNGLDEGQTYYFAVQAVDLAGQKSPYSDELCVTIPVGKLPAVGGGGGVSAKGGSAGNSGFSAPKVSSKGSSSEAVYEVGTVNADCQWQRVELTQDFSNPVVIVGPPSNYGSMPYVIRIRNVESNSFEVKFQPWNYLGSTDDFTAQVPYLIIEEGVHVMDDDTIWEAGTYEINGTLSWEKVSFENVFSATPVLLQTIQTYNDDDPVVVREKDVTSDGFAVALQEEEALDDGHGLETIGYLAVEPQTTVADVSTLRCGNDPVSVRGSSLKARLYEEQSLDDEVAHAHEQVAIMDVDGHYFAQIFSFQESDTVLVALSDQFDEEEDVEGQYGETTQDSGSEVNSFLSNLYQEVLGRTPDTSGVSYWQNVLETGRAKPVDVVKSFVFSKEFINKGTSSEEFVRVLYRSILGRSPDTQGLDYWVGMLDSGRASREAAAHAFLNSPEFRQVSQRIEDEVQSDRSSDLQGFVSRLYNYILERSPDQQGLDYWVAGLEDGAITPKQMVQSFVFSPEFTGGNHSDEQFVTVLYRSVLGREPDEGGKRYWLSVLGNRVLDRTGVADAFVESQEFSDICAQYGLSPE